MHLPFSYPDFVNAFFFFFAKTSDASSKNNDEVTDDLKTLLHEVRSLISSFQAHVSQTATPARSAAYAFASQGPPERGPLDDGPVHPNKPKVEDKAQNAVPRDGAPDRGHFGSTIDGETHSVGRAGRNRRKKAPKERLRPRPVVHIEHEKELDRGSVSSLTTDLNSRVSSDCDLNDGDEMEEIVLPLHSSSPKKDSVESSEYSQTLDRQSVSTNSDDSDVTSLLIDQSTSTGDTVISRDVLNAPCSWKPRSSASSVSSSQEGSSKYSDVAPFLKETLAPSAPESTR